ncbi:MAG: tetratricopeptide repeat protein [Flavobacteriales bacterium]|nr:tetratricopeptide repeat protein [Flavobacteriales bacterium]
MKNLLRTFVFVFAFCLYAAADAQTIKDGIKKTMNERYEAASADFRALLAKEPSNAAAMFYSGDNYYYWGQLDSAETMFTKGAATDPALPLNYVGLGRLAWNKGNAAGCAENFTKAHGMITAKGNKVPMDVQVVVLLKMAETYILSENKNLDQANAYIQQALKLNDKNPEVYIQWGDMNFEKGSANRSDVIAQYNKAYDTDPTYTRALLRQGQLWSRVKNYDLAIEWLDKAITNDPNFAPAYREKGDVLFRSANGNSEKVKQAAEAYKRYLELNDSPSARTKYVGLLMELKEYALALEQLNRVMKSDSSNALLFRGLGYSYFETKDYGNAVTNMKKFFSKVEGDDRYKVLPSDYSYLGRAMIQSGQDSLGVEQLMKAVDMDADYLEGYSEIASVYYKQKKYDLAAQYYKARITHSRKPEQLDYFFLGKSLYFAKNYTASDSAFMACSGYAESFYWRGQCNAKLDNQEAPTGLAKPFFETFITKVGTDPANIEANKKNLVQAYSYLGFYYYTVKNFSCSRAAWTEVQKLDAANEKAKAALTDKDIAAADAGACILIMVPEDHGPAED